MIYKKGFSKDKNRTYREKGEKRGR